MLHLASKGENPSGTVNAPTPRAPSRGVFDWKVANLRGSLTEPAPNAERPGLTSLDPAETNVGSKNLGIFGQTLVVKVKPDPVKNARERALEKLWATKRETADHFRRTGYGAFSLPPVTREEVAFRHSGWLDRREAVQRSFVRTNVNAQRQERFASCGCGCQVQRSPSTGAVRVSANLCHDRFCVPCGSTRSRLIAANLERHLNGRESRFLTLTLKHYTAPLSEQLTRLLTCFRNLRASKLWTQKVTGGAAFLEVKRSKCGRHWHPHLHVIVEGKYLPQSALSRQWLIHTGDSHVVDVRYVRDRNEVIRYVAKYAAKPLDGTLFTNDEWLDEACLSLRGRRLCTTFGTWRGVELEERPAGPEDWVPVASLTAVMRAAEAGEEWAGALLSQLRGGDAAQRPSVERDTT